jgi:hypothetical protein
MPIHRNPANTRLATDLKIFRRKIQTPSAKDPDSDIEIRKHLNKKAPGKYGPNSPVPPPKDKDIMTGEAYRDLSSWQSPKAKKDKDWVQIPNRLGGGLDEVMPDILDPDQCGGLPIPISNSAVSTFINWIPEPNHPQITVEILPGGIIKHTEIKNGVEVEIHAAHHYMHGIFSHILYKVRELLEDINRALEAYADVVSIANPTPPEAATYSAAVDAFEEYCADLQPGGASPFSGCFNFVGINPVVTNEGFIVSCRVKMNWRNPYHSSSTIKIP